MTTTPPGQRLLMAAAIIVATAAGIVGAIMLVAPGSTGRSSPGRPRALAALVGGFYVVSAPVFAYADDGRPSRCADWPLRSSRSPCRPWRRRPASRHLRLRPALRHGVGGAVRGQRIRRLDRPARPAPPGDPRLHPAARAVFAVLAAFAGLAVWFWVNINGPVPFAMAPLGARFLAAWLAFFAVLAAWPAVRPARTDAGAAAGAGRVRDRWTARRGGASRRAGPGAGGYLAGLVIVVAVPALVLGGTGLRDDRVGLDLDQQRRVDQAADLDH